ncbi:unnamed protein product, partial [Didymodactylos carnosus]
MKLMNYYSKFIPNTKLNISHLLQQSTVQEHVQLIQKNLHLEPIEKSWKSFKVTQAQASLAQERIWLDERIRFNEGNMLSIYNISIALKIKSNSGTLILISQLRSALLSIINRHKTLRTSLKYNADSECLEQRIKPMFSDSDTEHLYSFQISSINSTTNELEEILKDEVHRQWFNLEQGIVMRCHIVKTTAMTNENVLENGDLILFNFHHCAFDGYSRDIFFNDLQITLKNPQDSMNDDCFDYIDYAINERQMLLDENEDGAREYWKIFLDGYPIDKQLQLSYDHPDKLLEIRNGHGSSVKFEINHQITEAMLNYAKQFNITMFELSITCFYTFLYKLTNEEDLCIGSFNANRYRPEFENTIGMFVNTIPYRFKIDHPNVSFHDLHTNIHQICLTILRYSHLPLQEILKLHRNNKIEQRQYQHSSSFFNIVFAYENVNSSDLCLKGAICEPLDNAFNVAKFDMLVRMTKRKNSLSCIFEYPCDLFEQSTIDQMCNRFHILLQQLFLPSFNLKNQPIYKLSLLLPEEIKLLQDISQTSVDFGRGDIRCIHHEFVYQAIEHPQKIAIALDGQSLTYGETLFYVQQIAIYLILELQVKPGQIICQCVERSIEMVIGILAILTTGGIYCPLNSDDSLSRLHMLIKETQSTLVLLHSITQTKFHSENVNSVKTLNAEVSFLNLEQLLIEAATRFSDQRLSILANIESLADDIAYILFTSGSTGKPKAAAFRHKHFISCIYSCVAVSIMDDTDVFLQIAQCSFDVHLKEILGCTILGGTLIMLHPNGNLEMDYLSQVFSDKNVSFVDIVPSLATILCEYLDQSNNFGRLKTMRSFCFSGEAVNPKTINTLASYLQPKTKIINVYGPAECNICSTYHILNRQELTAYGSIIPIGRPIPNYSCYILDKHFQPVEVGKVAELYISRTGLFAGYLNRDDLTEQALLNIPGIAGKCYKTGDLARYNQTGEIIYIGRSDFQIKLRG